MLADNTIDLRPMTLADAKLSYQWRNDPRTWQHFFNPGHLEFDDHQAWLANSLQNKNRHLLMALLNDSPVGVIRFDCGDNQAEISIYLDPQHHGQGIGSALLDSGVQWAAQHLPAVERCVAKVKTSNLASQKAFTKAGFVEQFQVYYCDLQR